MSEWNSDIFQNGSRWVRADFHLHTQADKEFKFSGEDSWFVSNYIDALKSAEIRLAVITNHNKFDYQEFASIRKTAEKNGICVLPGIELSVNDGANGVHTLVVFSDEWLEQGKDFINQFLASTFKGKVPSDYEHENGRSSQSITQTLEELDSYHKDFFCIFAHVEAPSGLWKELNGGRLQELARHELVKKYCLGFQKVRTHDKSDAKCRVKVKQWWGEAYPAEVEGSDAKNIDEIGRGKHCYLKLGEPSFESVKHALTDFSHRVSEELPDVTHSRIDAVKFEGGLLNGVRVPLSPNLNCLIGIRGSGKSAILEAVRYALDIPFSQVTQDKTYKEDLLPYVLQSGGKVVIEASDRHGSHYEIRRIVNHSPDVYFDGQLQNGVSIKETVLRKPLYFGQKDLASAGKGFGHDLVEKLVGESLTSVRQNITNGRESLVACISALSSLETDVERKEQEETQLKDVEFRLEQFNKFGVKESLDKQIEFDKDVNRCQKIEGVVIDWSKSLSSCIEEVEDALEKFEEYDSKFNSKSFDKLNSKFTEFTKSIDSTKEVLNKVEEILEGLKSVTQEIRNNKEALKESFAESERQIVQVLADKGVTSIKPDEFVNLSNLKDELSSSISELAGKTAKYSQKETEVYKALAALNDGWLDEFRLIESALEQINESHPALHVEANFKGDKVRFAERLEEVFRGNSIRKETYQSLADKYADFGEIYKDLDNASLEAKTKSQIFKDVFIQQLNKLLTFQVPNSYKITYHGKDLKSHSLGQRASAMMLFILSQKDNDVLIIDQPEDDLDGQSIYEEIVKLVRKLKPRQQFIFATHNANFPVLGDSEMIISCSFDEKSISVSCGSIDNKTSQSRIVNIMEGGKEAFERRRMIYQQWEK